MFLLTCLYIICNEIIQVMSLYYRHKKSTSEVLFQTESKINDRLSASDNSFHRAHWCHPHHPATALYGWFPHPDRVICH